MRLKHLKQLKEITNLYKVAILFERYLKSQYLSLGFKMAI